MLLTLAIAWAALMVTRSLPYWPVKGSLTTSPWYVFQLDLIRCLWAVLPASVSALPESVRARLKRG